MIFAAPWAFYFLLMTTAVVALYILKVKRRRENVPSLAFWMRLVRETKTTSLFKKLKRLLSLLLQILILLLLILALANPILSSALIKRESIVVIVDASASMKALEGKHTRFELARKVVADIITAKGYEDDMMIILAAGTPLVVSPFTKSAKKLHEDIKNVAPVNSCASLGAAFELACELLVKKEHPLVYIVSDGSGGEVKGLTERNNFTRYHKIGTSRRNVGIAAFEARKNTGLMSDFLFARVKNYSDKTEAFSVELFVDQELKYAEASKLPAGAELQKTFPPFSLPEGALVQLHLDAEDNFSVDDKAYGIIRPTRKAKVILVTPREEELFFRAALDAMGEAIDEESLVISPGEYAALAPEARRADVTILNSCTVAVEEIPGDIIAVNLKGENLPVKVLGEVKRPVVTDWERDHMVVRYITFSNLYLSRAQKVASRTEAKVLLDGNCGPLILLFEERRKIVYIAFNVMDTDIPFRIAFPALLRNIITYFEEEEHALFRSSYRTGEAIFPARRLPPDIKSVRIVRLSGTEDLKEDEVQVSDGSFLYGKTNEPGYYRISVGDRTYFAGVNLPPSESDITPVETEAQEGQKISASLLGREFWLYFVVAGLLLFLVEWLLFNRRITE
jgi:hypothetical protein